MPTMVVNEGVPFDREALLSAFKAANIDGRVFFWPLSSLDLFEVASPNAVSKSISWRAINLPSYHDLEDAAIIRVSMAVKATLESDP
jgi:perosamine synthetase